MNLPTVSHTLKIAIRNRAYHAPLFSTLAKIFRLVWSDVPGKTTKVTTKTKARATRKVHATLKLFFIMMKKAWRGETIGCDLRLGSSEMAGFKLVAVLLMSFDEPC